MQAALQGAQGPAARCPRNAAGAKGASLLAPTSASSGAGPLRPAPQAPVRRRQYHAEASGRQRGGVCQAVATWTLASYEDELGWRSDYARCYQTGALIGQGSFGSVYKGVSRSSGKEVAVKVLPKVRGKLTREKTLDKIAREVDVVERLQASSGVVQLEDVFEDADAVSIVTELCSGGDLQQYSEARGGLDERALAHVAFEVLRIVKACHDAGMLHGDVKPANFCLKHPTHNPLASPQHDWSSAQAWLKAIDFGCSQNLPVHRYLTKRSGTPVYMAPEVYGRAYHREADMWSVGVMLYQLYARRFPFWDTMEGCKASALDEVARAVQTADIAYNYAPWTRMSPEGRSFVAACLQRDPAQRLTVEQALQHPWLAQTLSHHHAAAPPAAAAAAAAAPSYEQQQAMLQQQQIQQVVLQTQQVMASVRAPQYQQAVARVRATQQPAQHHQQALRAALAAAGPTPYAPQQLQHLQQQQQQQHPQQQQQQAQHSGSSRVAAAQAA